MGIFTFRARSADRDRETDEARFSSLLGNISDLIGQVEREKRGLSDRYERVAANAAFSMQRLENRSSAAMATRVDDLTQSLASSRARLVALDAQLDGLRELHRAADDFAKRTLDRAKSQRD